MAFDLNLGFIHISDHGVDVNPNEFSVGVHVDGVGVGAAVTIDSDGLNAHQEVNFGKGYEFQNDNHVCVQGGQVKVGGDTKVKVEGYDIVNIKRDGHLGVDSDGNLVAECEADGKVADVDVQAGVHGHVGPNGVGADAAANAGLKVQFRCDGFDDMMDKFVQAVADKVIKDQLVKDMLHHAITYVLDEMSESEVLKELHIASPFKNQVPMECEFAYMTGLGVGADIKSGLKDNDGYRMYGGAGKLEISEAEVSVAFYYGWKQETKQWKVKGGLEDISFSIRNLRR